jgi:hypothetical protein
MIVCACAYYHIFYFGKKNSKKLSILTSWGGCYNREYTVCINSIHLSIIFISLLMTFDNERMLRIKI